VHHVLLRGRLDVLIAHCLDCFLLRVQLVLEDLKLDTVFRDSLPFIIECASKPLHLFSNALFVSFEKADFLRVKLVVLTLVFDSLSSSIESLSFHAVTLYLLLELVVYMHNLGLFFVELSLSLLESSFLGGQVLRHVLGVIKFFAKLELRYVHFLAIILSGDFDLLDLNLQFFHLLNRFLLLSMSRIVNFFFIGLRPFHLEFQVNGAASDLTISCACSRFLVLNVTISLLLLLIIFIASFLLPSGEFILLSFDLPSPLLQLDPFLLENAPPFSQVLIFRENDGLT